MSKTLTEQLEKKLAIAKKALEIYSKDDFISEGGGRFENANPYIARQALKELEKGKLKLEKCKVYKTRDSRKVMISFIDNGYAFGCLEEYDKICIWNLDGTRLKHEGYAGIDIVSEWSEE